MRDKMKLQIEKFLTDKGIRYKLIKLSQNAYTVDDVIKFSEGRVNPEEICKTIILRGRKTDKSMAVFLRGNDKLDFSKLKKIFGEEVAIADAERVKKVAGVEPGAVCPFLIQPPLFVDEKVFELENVHCGSGHHLFGIEFKTEDLGKGVVCEISDFSKPFK